MTEELFTIAPVVEGDGDVIAVPALLRRLVPGVNVARPVKIKRSGVLNAEQLYKYASIAAANIKDNGCVLVVFDADDDCPVELARKVESLLADRMAHVRSAVALPVREFEAWIIAGDSQFHIEHVETIRDAKKLLKDRYGVYAETADQARLIVKADLGRLRQRSRSFRHFEKTVIAIVPPPTAG